MAKQKKSKKAVVFWVFFGVFLGLLLIFGFANIKTFLNPSLDGLSGVIPSLLILLAGTIVFLILAIKFGKAQPKEDNRTPRGTRGRRDYDDDDDYDNRPSPRRNNGGAGRIGGGSSSRRDDYEDEEVTDYEASGGEGDDIVTLLSADGEEIDFQQIAGIAYRGKFYAILQPVELMEGMDDDEALVFRVSKDSDGEDKFELEENDAIIDAVFEEYNKLLDKELGR